ncbi:YigZ family protein [Lactobacillus psittaci]|uniref:YigZ family protein n=1 Tax=Lactobacillus psittaci TaxID=116089 RepID=UPI0003FCA0B8|nr:YigZ family protein [Lactobacillus psittaci]
MSEKENYLTIKESGSNELTIKKSRFITTMARVTNKEEAETFVNQISKKYHDATHNTYAYTIGLNDDQVKASDNGEPQGTAGVVELRALQLMKLKNVAVVVTRYFGGIKLGAGGLIRAYSNSVTEAAQAIGVIKRVYQEEIYFSIPYNRLDEVNHFLDENEIFVAHREFTTDVKFTIFIEESDLAKFENELTELLNGQVNFNNGTGRYNEIPVKEINYHEQN